ncbi:MAG: peroxiredoxin [Alphaproteobacteria bacterium]|nr:peroxiredoxin [Alphaproteobacteria bacterium]
MKQLPNFTLQGIDSQGVEKTYTNKDFLGKKLVIYFYPKDNTPGCTKEACSFNAILPQILGLANIVGVSGDSISSHKKFRENYSLAFPLLADANLNLAAGLGALKDSSEGEAKKISRSTFIIDEKGNVIKDWKSVKVDGHDMDVLSELKRF